jgi:hypothetical protein
LCGSSFDIDVPKGEFEFYVNLTSPCVPIVSEGKMPDLEPFFSVAKYAIEKAVSRAAKYLPAIVKLPPPQDLQKMRATTRRKKRKSRNGSFKKISSGKYFQKQSRDQVKVAINSLSAVFFIGSGYWSKIISMTTSRTGTSVQSSPISRTSLAR